jgi:hypothetical protein
VKRNEPRRHHYVPEAYQKGFVNPDESIWLYDRKTQRYTKTHPRVICCENELYTIDPEGLKDRRVESKFLSSVDGDAITTIRQLERRERLDRDWMESFSIFMALLITRSPAFRKMTIQNLEAMHAEYFRIGFTDVERARHLLEEYRKRSGDPAKGITAESLVESVAGGHLRPTVNERPFLEQMLGQLEFLARWIGSFDWQILEAPSESGFITCDYPFVIVPSPEHPELIGFAYPGTVKYFPLTKSLCLRMGEQGYEFSYVRVNRAEARVVNQNIAVNSERFIMGPNRPQLEHVIGRSDTIRPPAELRHTVETIQTDGDGSLIGFNFWPRRNYFYVPR